MASSGDSLAVRLAELCYQKRKLIIRQCPPFHNIVTDYIELCTFRRGGIIILQTPLNHPISHYPLGLPGLLLVVALDEKGEQNAAKNQDVERDQPAHDRTFHSWVSPLSFISRRLIHNRARAAFFKPRMRRCLLKNSVLHSSTEGKND